MFSAAHSQMMYRLCLVFFVFFAPVLAHAQEPHVDSKRPRERAEVPKAELFVGCSPGIPIREGKLPEGFVYADREKKTAILPIVGDLEKHLEPGDILVQADSEEAQLRRMKALAERGSFDLYTLANRSYVHTQLVYADRDKNLRILEVPLEVDRTSGVNQSKPEETERPFHILRLRRDMDPEKRKDAIDKMNRFARFFATGVPVTTGDKQVFRPFFGYGKEFGRLPVCDPAKRAAILEAFRKYEAREEGYYKPFLRKIGAGNEEPVLKFLCSGMPATVYALSGQPIPEATSFPTMLGQLEELISPKPSTDQLIRVMNRYLDEHFSLSPYWPPDLATREEVAEFEKTKVLPPKVVQYREDLRKKLTVLFSLPPKLRPAAFKAKHEPILTPADYVDDVLKKEGFLSYAGTWVGKKCAEKAR